MRPIPTTAVCTVTQLGVARTLVPFLYETKTLMSGRYLKKAAAQNIHSWSANGRRRLPDSSITFRSTNISTNTLDVSSRADSRIYKHDTFYNGDIRQAEGDGEEKARWKYSARTADRTQKRRPIVTEDRGIPFEDGDILDNMAFSGDLDALADDETCSGSIEGSNDFTEAVDRPARESTITVTERQAFERIFADILARSKQATGGVMSSLEQPDDQTAILAKESGPGRPAKESILSIMDAARDTDRTKTDRPARRQVKNRTREDIIADVDQYPVPLRAAAARALGLASARSAESSNDEIISNANELEDIRRPELERVEKLLHNASSDTELWQVLESEVFALIARLGLGDKSKAQIEDTKSKGSSKAKKNVSEATKDHVITSSGSDQTLDLNIYGPLYPSYLLLGIRLLDRSFTKPSPLVLNILPRIKSLGIVSEVLGASTALYNELLNIYWIRYDDFNGVRILLNEMEQAGLEFDEETLSIVNEINQTQLKVRRGDRGSVLQALWSMPEFAPGKFRGWKEKIQDSIEEPGMGSSDEVAWQR